MVAAFRSSSWTSVLARAALVAVAFAVPLAVSTPASADVAPAPKKKGCAVEAGPGDAREGAGAFAVCAVATLGAIAARRARSRR